MTEAPETIWAWNTANCDGDWTIAEGLGIEYVRKDVSEAKIKALVEALDGMRELVRDEEFCLCEYKDNTTPADQGPEIDAADAALAAAKEPT